MNGTDIGQADRARHYAEAFSPVPGRSFRRIARPGAGGQPVHCPEPPGRRLFRAPNGSAHIIEACSRHAGPLIDRQPATPNAERTRT